MRTSETSDTSTALTPARLEQVREAVRAIPGIEVARIRGPFQGLDARMDIHRAFDASYLRLRLEAKPKFRGTRLPWGWMAQMHAPGTSVTLMLYTPVVLPFLRVWADPQLHEKQRWTMVAEMANRMRPDLAEEGSPDHSGAQLAFVRELRVFPDRKDGRFTFAGFTEPYPGCWPAGPVADAAYGDLSSLWPSLSAEEQWTP